MRQRLRHKTTSIEEGPEINLTPLIDVVFVILIMFIVIAPLLEIDRISLAKKSRQHSEESVSAQENSPLTIHVKEDNTIRFNNEDIQLEQLTIRFKEAKRAFPSARPQIFHDQKAAFGTYQSIKNAAENSGFVEMDIVLAPE